MQIRGNTGSVWERKICGVSTDFIKERSFKSSDDWTRFFFSLHVIVSFKVNGQKFLKTEKLWSPLWYSNEEGHCWVEKLTHTPDIKFTEDLIDYIYFLKWQYHNVSYKRFLCDRSKRGLIAVCFPFAFFFMLKINAYIILKIFACYLEIHCHRFLTLMTARPM